MKVDADAFAELEDAYGLAVDVPGYLETIAHGSEEAAHEALALLEGHVFHQGTFYPAAATAIPYLIAIAATDGPARAAVLGLLGELGGVASEHAHPKVFVDALLANDARTRRVAARALATIGEGRDAVEAALVVETDPDVAAELACVRSLLGGAAPTQKQIERVLVDAPGDDRGLERLVAHVLPLLDGVRAFDVVTTALESRLARGEAVHDDVVVRIVSAATGIAFGDRANGPPLRRADLTARMRRLVELAARWSLHVPARALPANGAELARFLRGDGPLDEVLASGVPAYEALRAGREANAPDGVAPLIAELAARLDPTMLARDLLAAPYGLHLGGPYGAAVVAPLSSLSLDEPERAAVLRLSLATQATKDPAGARARLAELDEPRRSRLVASFTRPAPMRALAPACDPDAFVDALVDALVAPDQGWFDHEIEAILAPVPLDRLRPLATLASPAGRAVRAVLRDRTGHGAFTLDLRAEGDAVRAVLRTRETTVLETRLDGRLLPDTLSPIVAAVAAVVEPRIELEGDLDDTRMVRVQSLLGTAVRGEIVHGGSTLRST